MKAFVNYLLSLCILLVSGVGQFLCYANTSDSLIQQSLKGRSHADFRTKNDSRFFVIKTSSSGKEKPTFKIDATENEVEEDEVTSSKKQLEDADYAHAILFTQILGWFFSQSKQVLPFCKSYSCNSSDLYLVFQVLRI
ncbi:hypothetical protein [Chryseosolibacter indicus]|uniref:Uncharacterized protein n=1 Tax=Chryseosolibacter indicus TaxID=2782351 RepID=A0ABS5W1U2_9BACT|nr:hypothetical protein [Chryseosolibacter indicus]MBT1706216.1 hypothetical protein [Chryseosolibacter indicus]